MQNINETILVTGAAGFIGAALVKKLLENGFNVVGIDNINNYYDQKLKFDRLEDIKISHNKKNIWVFKKVDLADEILLKKVFDKYNPKIVVNLAAQAGVRYSIENPEKYIHSNLIGFFNLIECCKKFKIENFIYASSSSVYGSNTKTPFYEDQAVNHPVSLYAATKKSNELIAHAYSNLYGIPSTGLRFFTVYGPWGRPDMAPMIFANAIYNKKPIDVFNMGNLQRDFTYIDDVVEGVYKCCLKPATSNNDFDTNNPEASSSFAPHRIFNIGNSKPVNLLDFIEIMEEKIGLKAIKNFMPMQAGDVLATLADNSKLKSWVGFRPQTPIKEGINLFIDWFKKYYSK